MSDLRRRAVVILLVCVSSLWLVSGSVAGVGTETTGQAEPASGFVQQEIDADSVELSADIDTDGDATWQVRHRLRLEDETDERVFDDLRADIEANRSAYLDPFEERIRGTAGTAENATGREMTVEQFDMSTERREQPQGVFGIVTYEFEWNSFAAVDGDRIRAGDAVDQLFLAENERLEFRWPASHSLDSRSPEPDVVEERRVVWRGQTDFDTGQPRVELTTGEESGVNLLGLAGGVILVGLLAVAGLYWREQRTATETTEADQPATTAGTAAGESESADSTAEPAAATGSTEPPSELLSNEEQALQLLNENGGRMKQKTLAEELDWSAAKTSQVVGDLRDDDKLESFRLGRENVLTLPEVDLEESTEDDAE